MKTWNYFALAAMAAVSIALSARAQSTEPAPQVLARPPFVYTAPAGGGKPSTKVRLKQISMRARGYEENSVWLKRHGLTLPTYNSDLPNGERGDIPPAVAETMGPLKLVRAVPDGGRSQLVYGPDYSGGTLLAGYDGRKDALLYQFDFSNYILPPVIGKGEREFVEEGVQWAQSARSLLYVSNFHRTYARSSKGQNGYITAIDTETGKLKWRSRPLVCNTANFILLPDAILTGYGFTAEKDFLYVLDRKTGAVTQTLPVRSGPEWLVVKDGKLFVHCYDADYVFRIGK